MAFDFPPAPRQRKLTFLGCERIKLNEADEVEKFD